MNKAIVTTLLVLLHAGVSFADNPTPLLLQKPALSRTQIAFVYAGDLWLVSRQGGDARRLTTGPGLETDPVFSPDGSQIAFSGEYDGNLDVYVVSATGGQPRRLTFHPGPDRALGWTPDGKQVLFRSARHSYSRFNRLFTIPVKGGFPTELPLPMAEQGAFSPDGSQLAYVPFWNRRGLPNGFISWKHYRGGKASPIWIARLSDSKIEKVPRKDSNDWGPMWVGERVYFLSDRSGAVTLFAYDPATKKVAQVLDNDGLDILSASAGPDAIVYEKVGSIHLFDLKSGKSRPVDVRVRGDFPAARPHFVKVGKQIREARLSPSGVRAVFEARGEILTVPAKKGDVRNLTRTPGVAERDPAWSPSGKWIAYFSDESGEYALHLRDQRGAGEVRKISLGSPPSFFYHPVWSPDSKKIAYTDKRLNVWYVELATKKLTRVDTDTYDSPYRALDPAWSPDSRWLAYTKQLRNHLRAVFVHSLRTGKNHRLTDGMSDARSAAFDRNGKYLYFTASTDVGPTTGWLDLSSFNRPVSRSVYVIVLRKDLPSPIPFESDEETAEEETQGIGEKARGSDKNGKKKPAAEPDEKKGKKAKEKPKPVRIDLEDIDQRILALPIPPRNYTRLTAGKSGKLFLLEGDRLPRFGQFGGTLHRFDLEKRTTDKLLEGVSSFEVSHDGGKMLYSRKMLNSRKERWFIGGTESAASPAELKVDAMEVRVEPRAEWRQMYREVWRIQRDFLYDPGHHGLDLKAAAKKYEPYLAGVASRADLNYLFNEMLGNLNIGHLYVGGGVEPRQESARTGLLGADFRIENGRYRLARVYHGENWNPSERAPLTQPAVNVKAGEYLLAVGGREVRGGDNVYRLFEGTAGKAVVLKVGPRADGTGAREVTVVPVESEAALRHLAWIEDNRRKVDKLSGGKVAYVHLPNTAFAGYTNFNRYFFAQVGKQGAILDERFNGGGMAADYIIDYLRRPLMNYWTTREGADFTTPLGAIFGPKAMIVNEFAGSGGDAMPWYFRKAKIGPLIGTRTWGGLIGIYDYPPLLDGGQVTAPRLAFWKPEGDWEVENRGVAPDVEVDLDPEAVRSGRDPQLEKAVQVVLEAIKKNPPPRHRRPAYPNYYRSAVRRPKAEQGASKPARP
jgi:tricorn protease